MININRRCLVKALASVGVGSAAFNAPAFSMAAFSRGADDWDKAAAIRASVVKPVFANKDFAITRYGAKGDGKTDASQAISDAIKACASAGGGRVLVQEGTYRTGPIHLLSGVNLHVEKGATLSFVTQPARYLPAVFTRWEGIELMGYSPLIYAHNQENIAVTGEGVLDGGANDESWWPWKGPRKDAHWKLIKGEDQKAARTQLFADAERGVDPKKRYYAEGSYLRPPFIQPYSCKNVLIEGVTLINSPFWLLNPVLCENVTIEGVTCRSHGPNNDGCDPESCKNVVIKGCYFDTGDDCIALKSGRNADGRRVNVPCENVVISECKMRDGHGGLVIG
ncbi:MAG: glycoside hydrolase family 28 protein, partial [Spongiibacteraceae bacterium]|nr:glycoside hydrolase family 28 protein [Spongiibacteraceae bacterium]